MDDMVRKTRLKILTAGIHMTDWPLLGGIETGKTRILPGVPGEGDSAAEQSLNQCSGRLRQVDSAGSLGIDLAI